MGPFGSNIKVDNFIESGVPVLNGKNVSDIKLIENSFNYVSEEKAISLKKANAKRGDIVITHRGTLGQICYIPENSLFDNYVISQSQFRVSLKKDLINAQFFVYYFHTDEGQQRLLANKSYVGVPALAQATSNFKLIDFPLISLAKQNKIANILSTLDAKIELNNKINTELEAMAKTLYDYWFVQFDFPNAKGEPYKSSGGKMVYNEELKREIPEGWEVRILEDIESNIITGKTPPKKEASYFNGNIPFITIGDIRGNMHIVTTEETLTNDGAEYQKTKYLNKGAICVSCIASPGLVAFATELSQTNQQINSIECEKEENKFYLYFALIDFFIGSKAKTGNTFPNMNKGDFSAIEFIYPNENILIEFKKLVKPIFDNVLNNLEQNQTLKAQRDFLLPMLMNGQVSVK